MTRTPDFSALFDASSYPYLLIATDYIIIGANPAYLRATGRTAEEILGKHIFDAFPANPADPGSTNLEEVRTSIELAISTRQPHTSKLLRYAVPRQSPEGTVFDDRVWSAIHTPVFDKQGNVAFVAQNAIDVTDLYRFDETSKLYYLRENPNAVPDVADLSRAQMHEAMTRILNAERNELQILFNQAPGFIAVLKGKNHVFEAANESYYQLVGHRDIIGKPVVEALPEVAGQGFKELLDQVFATGHPILMHDRHIALQRETDKPTVECYMDLLYQPIFGGDGQVTGIFAQGNDVTEAYRAKQNLAEKVQQLEEARARQAFQLALADMLRHMSETSEIFQASCEIIGRHFKVSRVIYGDYNREHKTVTFHANYVDGTVDEVKGTYSIAAFGAENFASIEEGTTWICDDLSTDPRTSGSGTWPTFKALGIYSGIVVPLTRKGAVIACLFINASQPRHWTEDEVYLVQDAADRVWTAIERVRAETGLKQANRRKDQFLAMLAHELRNPLAPITAAAELLKFAEQPPELRHRTSDIISRQVRHMTALIDDLLDVSRVSRGLVVLDTGKADIKQAMTDAVEQVRPLIEARKHRFSVQLPLEQAFVLGDYKRLVQVMANLIGNAAKYTPEGGTILAQVEIDQECVVIRVVDNGIGISPELLPHVFQLFSQGERSPDRSQGGLGLGLALVKNLVELHGGSVKAESQGLNAGSQFTVRLPRLAKSQQEPVTAMNNAEEMPFAQSKPEEFRVLVVDDNLDAANSLGMFLQAKGYQVVIEHDAFRALERAKQESFKAFLLDIGLPGMDGNLLARHLRTLPEGKSAFMVAITGYGNDFNRESSMKAGFDEYVVKPANPSKIISLLRNTKH